MPDFAEDVFFSTISELSARLKAREFSAVELTRAYCDRLEKLGPRYNALALSLREAALKQARDIDGDIKRGRFRGPLQGIPYGAKDLLSVEGRPTTWGAMPFASQVFPYDATAIQKLEKTGATVIGKLAMVELAGGGGYRYAAASLFGPGLNPWDRSRWSGGSSSGSGSAVAAGPGALRLRLGDVGFHQDAMRLLRDHGSAAHLRAGQPAWRDGAFLDHGQDRPDVPLGGGLRAGAGRDRGRRFAGSGLGR